MTLSRTDSLLESRITYRGLIGLTLLLFAMSNLPWQLDDYDQAKQAFTSFEMVEQGHWFYQHTPNERVATKPPLVGWISAATYTLTRWWDGAWRLPSFAAATALLILIGRTTREAYGLSAAIVAASAFGLNLFSPRLATLVRTDMPLTLVIFLLGSQIWKKVSSQRAIEPWTSRDRVIAFVLLTAAMLIKGPIVYAFLLPGIVAYQWRRRRLGGTSAWCGWWPWVASLGVFLAWAIGGMLWAPGFYENVVVKEFAGRFTETVHRPQPIYFYVTQLTYKFLPWSIVLLAFATAIVRSNRVRLRESWTRMSPNIFWLVCWSVGGLIVMSLIPSKRPDRIFPIVPPLCLLVAAQFARLKLHPQLGNSVVRWSEAAILLACVFSTVYSAQKIVSGFRDGDDALINFANEVRSAASTHQWRYEVVKAKDEGMLLYLRRTRFLDPDEALAGWNSGEINAVVAPNEKLPQLLPQLSGAKVVVESSTTRNDNRPRYALLVREL
jgi:4-amino-4-deoxy-L-arabinose transferase-like glycosyltransferase